MEKFYRIKVHFLETDRLSDDFKAQFRQELTTDNVYLGIRLNPTMFKRSAAINSLELAHQCMELAKDALSEYGPIVCTILAYPCTTDFMKSIIDTDSRMLQSQIQAIPMHEMQHAGAL